MCPAGSVTVRGSGWAYRRCATATPQDDPVATLARRVRHAGGRGRRPDPLGFEYPTAGPRVPSRRRAPWRRDLGSSCWRASRCSRGCRRSTSAGSATSPSRRTTWPGASLVKQGTPGDAFFVILEGLAKVVVGKRTINRLMPGDYFGEISLLDGGDADRVRGLGDAAEGADRSIDRSSCAAGERGSDRASPSSRAWRARSAAPTGRSPADARRVPPRRRARHGRRHRHVGRHDRSRSMRTTTRSAVTWSTPTGRRRWWWTTRRTAAGHLGRGPDRSPAPSNGSARRPRCARAGRPGSWRGSSPA